jgi:hypothetical protein
MKNLTSKLAAGALLLYGASHFTGCTTNTTIYEKTLRDNYNTINAPTLGVSNPDVDIAEYKEATPDSVRKAIPQNAGFTSPLETQLLYFNSSDSLPGRKRVNGAAGFSLDDAQPGNSEYMVLFVDKQTDPKFRDLGIAKDSTFDVYVDFVEKEDMHRAFGTNPENIPLVFIEDTDNSYQAHAATSGAEAVTFTALSGGNWAGGLLWGAGSMGVKTLTHYGFKDKPQDLMGYADLSTGHLEYDARNITLLNNLRNKLGGHTLSANTLENGLCLFSYDPEAFNEMKLSTVTEPKKFVVKDGLAHRVKEFTFNPDFRIEALEEGSPSYLYLIGLISAGVSGHLVGNGSDGGSGSSDNGGGNGNTNPGNIFDVNGGFGGTGQ